MQKTYVDEGVDEGCCTPRATNNLGESVTLQGVLTCDPCCPNEEMKDECPSKPYPNERQTKSDADK